MPWNNLKHFIRLFAALLVQCLMRLGLPFTGKCQIGGSMEVGLTPASPAFKEMLLVGGVVVFVAIICIATIAYMIRKGRRY